jgi:DNA topoisomerase III
LTPAGPRAPALVDPGTTAQWEMHLDAVVTGRADFRVVIDGIAAEAEKLITALRQRPRGGVDLQATSSAVLPAKANSGKRTARKPRGAVKEPSAAKAAARRPASPKPKRTKHTKATNASAPPAKAAASPGSPAPTVRMVSYARKLAKAKGVALPAGYDVDFQACRRFLDQHG